MSGKPAVWRGRERRTSPPVYRITGSTLGRSEDVAGRQNRYLVSMSIRTVCFLGAIATDGWLRWLLFVGAILLPYVSVVLANAGRESPQQVPLTTFGLDRPALEPAPAHQRRAS